MTISRAIIKDILSNLAVFSLPFSIVSVVYFLSFDMPNYFLLALIAPFLLMYVVRKRMITNRFTFVALHVLVILAVGFIISDRDSRWFAFTFLIATGLLSFYLKTRPEIDLGRVFNAVLFGVHITLFLILGFAPAHANIEPMQTLLIITILLSAAVSIIFAHMNNIDDSLNVLAHINDYNDPNSQVVSANNKLIAVFVGIIAVVCIVILFGTELWRAMMAFASGVWSDALDRGMYLWSAEFEGLPDHVPDYLPDHDELYYFIGTIPGGIIPAEDVAELDQVAFFYAFHRAINILAIIFVPLFAFLLIRTFFKAFYKRFRKKNDGGTSGDTVIVLKGNVMNDLRELFPRFKNKYGHPIRKAYAKKVNKHIKTGTDILTADTTDIIANKIRTTEDIDELTAKYERVRYGK